MASKERTRTGLARCVSAEIRSHLAVTRKSARWLAGEIGVSQNYLAKRLRDEDPLDLDDLAKIVRVIGGGLSVAAFVSQAWERHHASLGREKSGVHAAGEKSPGVVGDGADLEQDAPGVGNGASPGGDVDVVDVPASGVEVTRLERVPGRGRRLV